MIHVDLAGENLLGMLMEACRRAWATLLVAFFTPFSHRVRPAIYLVDTISEFPFPFLPMHEEPDAVRTPTMEERKYTAVLESNPTEPAL